MGLSLTSIVQHLAEEGEDLGEDTFLLRVKTSRDRSQPVYVAAIQNEVEDEDYDKVLLMSPFASLNEVGVSSVLELSEHMEFGFQKFGENYGICVPIRPWQMTDFDAFRWLVVHFAHVGDQYREALVGPETS